MTMFTPRAIPTEPGDGGLDSWKLRRHSDPAPFIFFDAATAVAPPSPAAKSAVAVSRSPSTSSSVASPERKRENHHSATGAQWKWDPRYQDFTLERDNQLVRYAEYQRSGGAKGNGADLQTSASATPTRSTSLLRGPPPNSNDTWPQQQRPKSSAGGSRVEVPRASPVQPHSLQPRPPVPRGPSAPALSRPLPGPEPRPLKSYETPLDERYRYVDKPKRFFSIGRIFKTVWFEPVGEEEPPQRPDASDWGRACPAFHSGRARARFRWFVVVRKRLHHSLCFAITTTSSTTTTTAATATTTTTTDSATGTNQQGNNNSNSSSNNNSNTKTNNSSNNNGENGEIANGGGGGENGSTGPTGPRPSRSGRPRDFVVLYAASQAVPPEPLPQEQIERRALAIIIEDGAQSISPFARLDCGRIYTVEDDLRVMKVGRIHPDSLQDLEMYYRESVE